MVLLCVTNGCARSELNTFAFSDHCKLNYGIHQRMCFGALPCRELSKVSQIALV